MFNLFKMNKKNITLLLALLVTTIISNANNNDMNYGIQKTKYNFYTNLLECKTGKFTYKGPVNVGGAVIQANSSYEIIGLEDNQCHTKKIISGFLTECKAPMPQAKAYAESFIDLMGYPLPGGKKYKKSGFSMEAFEEEFCEYEDLNDYGDDLEWYK